MQAANDVRVLVVDDDDDVRAALVADLSAFDVHAVATGEEAQAALEARPYDVVIADLHLPGASGVDVLAYARRVRAEAIPILLSGHLDDRAVAALDGADPPYRVGKPWHDELELVVRQALADRAGTASAGAHALVALDRALDAADDPLAIARVVVAHGSALAGVVTCAAIAGDHLIAGELGRGGAWSFELALDAPSDLRVCARGDGAAARETFALVAHRAQRRAAAVRARGAAGPSERRPHGQGKNELLRRATVGSLTAALLHDVASSIQGLQATVDVLCEIAGETADLQEAAKDVASASQTSVAMFLAMRKFIRNGEMAMRPASAASLMSRAVRVARNPRADVTVRHADRDALGVEVVVTEILFERILVNLIRCAAAGSQSGGVVDVDVTADRDRVVFSITDDGEADRVRDELVLEATDTDEDGAVELAVAAHLAQLHGAELQARADARPWSHLHGDDRCGVFVAVVRRITLRG